MRKEIFCHIMFKFVSESLKKSKSVPNVPNIFIIFVRIITKDLFIWNS